MLPTDEIVPFQSLSELHQAATDAFCELAIQSVQANGVFRVSLSGGSTPKRIYEMLSERDLPWNQIHWFWGDERNVPHDHADSNYRMICEAFLDRVPAPAENVHGVSVEIDNPAAAAAKYEETIRAHFPGDEFPRWDLVLLGMGDDAHTASLFPETTALAEVERWFVENWVEKFDCFRYTLTAPAINSARQSWFLVAGANKREALASVRSGERNPQRYPSQLVTPTRWFVTADAIG